MRLYVAVSTDEAVEVVANGFSAPPRMLYDQDSEGNWQPAGEAEWYVFRDLPPGGLTFSRTTESEVRTEYMEEEDVEERIIVTIDGGPVLMDDMGDFVLTIELPDDVALFYIATSDESAGWPFREMHLPPDIADEYRDTLKVYQWNLDGVFGADDLVEVRPDLVGK